MKNKNLTKEQLVQELQKLSKENESLRLLLESWKEKKNDRKSVENSPSNNAEIYKSLFNNTHSVMLLINPASGKIIDANPAAEIFYGWSKELMINKNISEINTLTPDQIKLEMEYARQQKRSQFFFKHRTATGEIKDVEVFSGPIKVKSEQLLYSIVHDITDKKRNEESLFYERTLLRTLIDNIPDLVYAKDLEARKTLANKADQLLMRVKSEEEALGKDDYAFYPSERAKEFVAEDKKVIETGEPAVNTEGFHIDEEGRWRWFITSKYPLRDADNKIIGLAGIGRDITEHKLREIENEQRLQNTYRQQTALVKLAQHEAIASGDLYATARIVTETVAHTFSIERVGIWFYNEGKTEIRCNDMYELSSKSHADGMVIQASDYPGYFKALEEGLCIDAQDALNDSRTSELKEKYLIPFNIKSMLDAAIRIEGRVIGIVCIEEVAQQRSWESDEIIFASELANQIALAIANDKKRKAELELRENVERQSSLIKLLQSDTGTVQEFLDLALEEAIKITRSKIGYIYHYHEDKKEFVLNSWSKEVMEECSIYEKQTIYQLDKTGIWGEAVRQRKEIILNDFQAYHPLKKGYPAGHVPLQRFLTIPFLQGEQIVAVVGVGNKATDYVPGDVLNLQLLMNSIWGTVISIKAEEAVLKSEMNLKKLNDEKDKLFSIIAHDLRSPFQGFLSITEMMAENVGNLTLDQLSAYSNEMNKSARNLFKLLRNLLDWSQVQQGTFEYFPKKHLLTEIVSFNIATYNLRSSQKEISINNEIDKNICVEVDERMINSIFSNILSNAIKFTTRNGKINIQAREIENRMVEVSVTDTGIGIPENLINRLFKIEEKVGRKGTEDEESTSLGLILCKEFVEKHGGKIWLESKVGVGSTFYFTLPKESFN